MGVSLPPVPDEEEYEAWKAKRRPLVLPSPPIAQPDVTRRVPQPPPAPPGPPIWEKVATVNKGVRRALVPQALEDLEQGAKRFGEEQGRFLLEQDPGKMPKAQDYPTAEEYGKASGEYAKRYTTGMVNVIGSTEVPKGGRPTPQKRILKDVPFEAYSRLEHAVEKAPFERGTAEQWQAALKPNVAAGEREWRGIDELLEAKKGQPVERAEIQKHLEENPIKIGQSQYGGKNPQTATLTLAEATAAGWRVVKAPDPAGTGFEAWVVQRPDGVGVNYGATRGEAEAWLVAHARDSETGGSPRPKFEGYKEPGGENYTENVLTLKDRELKDLPAGYTVERRPAVGPQNSGEYSSWVAAGRPKNMYADTFHVVDPSGTPVPNTEWGTAEEARKRGLQALNPKSFKQAGHFPDENPLVHERHTDHVLPNGEKVRFIEEMQSDWHQKGRKYGYGAKPAIADLEVTREADGSIKVYNRVTKRGQTHSPGYEHSFPAEATDEEIKRFAIQKYPEQLQSGSTVPDAPFKKTEEWTELALKAAIDKAHKDGIDRIAWTTGDQQAARYDLSKHVDEIRYEPEIEQLTAWKNGSNVHTGKYDKRALDDVIGKEAAENLLKAENAVQYGAGEPVQRLTGEGLKVGGHGMRAYYDRILPKVVQDYAKKMGVKLEVEPVNIFNEQPGGYQGPTNVDEIAKAARQLEEVDPDDAIAQSLRNIEYTIRDRLGVPPQNIIDHELANLADEIDPHAASLVADAMGGSWDPPGAGGVNQSFSLKSLRGAGPQPLWAVGAGGAAVAAAIDTQDPEKKKALPPVPDEAEFEQWKAEEPKFQRWYAEWAKKAGLDPDPDNPLHKYDYRAAYRAGAVPEIDPSDKRYHWPSEFKADDHPNRFIKGVDTKQTGKLPPVPDEAEFEAWKAANPPKSIWERVAGINKRVREALVPKELEQLERGAAKFGKEQGEWGADLVKAVKVILNPKKVDTDESAEAGRIILLNIAMVALPKKLIDMAKQAVAAKAARGTAPKAKPPAPERPVWDRSAQTVDQPQPLTREQEILRARLQTEGITPAGAIGRRPAPVEPPPVEPPPEAATYSTTGAVRRPAAAAPAPEPVAQPEVRPLERRAEPEAPRPIWTAEERSRHITERQKQFAGRMDKPWSQWTEEDKAAFFADQLEARRTAPWRQQAAEPEPSTWPPLPREGEIRPVAAAGAEGLETRPGIMRKANVGEPALPSPLRLPEPTAADRAVVQPEGYKKISPEEVAARRPEPVAEAKPLREQLPEPAKVDEKGLFFEHREPGGELRPFNRVSDDGLIKAYREQLEQLERDQQLAVYRNVEADVSGTQYGVRIQAATRTGRGTSQQAEAAQRVQAYQKVINRIDQELEKRGLKDDLPERIQAQEELEAAIEREAMEFGEREMTAEDAFDFEDIAKAPPKTGGAMAKPAEPPISDVLNVAKLNLENKTAEQRMAAKLEEFRSLRESQKQTFAEANVNRAEILNELRASDPLALSTEKAKKLSGEELLARRDLVRENDQIIQNLSKRLETAATAEEHEQAASLLQRAVDHNDALLSDLVVGSSQKGRDLNLLRRMAQNSLDPDVWRVQAKRLLGDRPLTAEIDAMIRKLAKEATDACG
jgi:hypothetical protein